MACIVYITNKKTNTKYAYRSESYRDPVTKQPKSRRTYLGRVDPVTNEIIPKAEKGKRNRNPIGSVQSDVDKQQVKLYNPSNNAELRHQIELLREQQIDLKNKIASMDNSISKIYSLIHEADL